MQNKIVKKKLLTIYVGTFFVLLMIIMGVIAKNNSNPAVRIITEKDEREAGDILNKGCTLFENNEYEEAIEIWEEVYYDYIGTTSWGKAAYNIGLAYICLEKYEMAIPYFFDILNSDVNDLEEGQCVMEAYRNYRHKSCLQISYCYEKLKKYEEALEYSILARDKYEYHSWCGTCAMSAARSLEYKIQRLESLKEWDGVTICEFKLKYELNHNKDVEYNIKLPFPVAEDNSSSFFINNTKIISGNPIYNLISTKYGLALNITSKGSCSFEIYYTISNDEDLINSTIFNYLSLEDEERKSSYWIYSSYNVDNWEDRIKFSLDGYWIRYPPDHNFYNWNVKEFRLGNNWNREWLYDYF